MFKSYPTNFLEELPIVRILKTVFSITYMVEGVLKIIAYSIETYFKDNQNTFEFLVILISTIERSLNGTTIFSSFRVFRLFNIVDKLNWLSG